jgi:hypothetical protein
MLYVSAGFDALHNGNDAGYIASSESELLYQRPLFCGQWRDLLITGSGGPGAALIQCVGNIGLRGVGDCAHVIVQGKNIATQDHMSNPHLPWPRGAL